MINLLELVLPAIRLVVDNQGFEYRRYQGQEIDDKGISVPSYGEWRWCEGSVQPMDAQNLQQYGLDAAKNGIQVWGSIDFNTLDMQDHADQVRYNGRIYNCDRVTKWGLANGWHSFACTEDKRVRTDEETSRNHKPNKGEGASVLW